MYGARVMRNGNRGMTLIEKCRAKQLTRREVVEFARREGFSELFVSLCFNLCSTNKVAQCRRRRQA